MGSQRDITWWCLSGMTRRTQSGRDQGAEPSRWREQVGQRTWGYKKPGVFRYKKQEVWLPASSLQSQIPNHPGLFEIKHGIWILFSV